MHYTKPPLRFDQQADLLLKRGLVGEKGEIVRRLREVNYYRLSAYWYPYRDRNSDNLRPGTSFEEVWRSYAFDRRLRMIAMDAIERIEVSLRTRSVNFLALKYGPFCYTEPERFPGFTAVKHDEFIERIEAERRRSRETFVSHFNARYHDERFLPLWIACELMSFGMLFTMFRNLSKHDQSDMAASYGVPAKVFDSWLLTLNYIRNLCAHHSRLWNRELAIKPFIPRQPRYSSWRAPVDISRAQDRIFGVLTIMRFLVGQIAPQSSWPTRFSELLAEYPNVDQAAMGVLPNWRASPIWSIS